MRPPRLLLLILSLTAGHLCMAQAENSELNFPARSTVGFHLTQQYESCPAGTHFKVKVSGSIDSRVNKTGDEVQGILAAALVCKGKAILPAGTHIIGRFVVSSAQSGGGADTYTIELVLVDIKDGNQWIRGSMDPSQSFARSQPDRQAGQNASRTNGPEVAASRPGQPDPQPLSLTEIAESLAAHKSQSTLVTKIARQGLDFQSDDGEIDALRLLGATDQIQEAVRHARFVYVDYTTEAAKRKAMFAQAESAFRSIREKRPGDTGAELWLGEILLWQGNNEAAIPELREAILEKPDLVEAHRSLGEALFLSGKKPDGISEIREAVRLNPNIAATHDTLSALLSSTGDSQSALAEARRAVLEAPRQFEPHFFLGAALLAQKSLDEAIEEFRTSVRLNPRHATSHVDLGQALFGKADYEGAVLEFKEAVRLSPRRANFHSWLSSALFYAGRFDECAAEARTALLYDPKSDAAKTLLANARTKLSETAVTTAPGSGCDPDYSPRFSQINVLGFDSSRDSVRQILEQQIAKYGGIPQTIQEVEREKQIFQQQLTQAQDGDDANTVNQLQQMLQWSDGLLEVLGCRQTKAQEQEVAARATAGQGPPPSSNRPPFDDKCIRMGQGSLGAVTFTNICTEPVDLKWCYRKHGGGDRWTCSVTTNLPQNHTLASPYCYQCSDDGYVAAYLSSRSLSSMLPSDEENSRTGSGGSSAPSSASTGNSSAPNDGQRRWGVANPAQNSETVYLEVRGRSGESTSDDWNNETPITSFSLAPGAQQLLTCGQWFSLDIRWYTSSSSNSQTDVYYASLICYANNFVWNNNHNLREFDFPRQ